MASSSQISWNSSTEFNWHSLFIGNGKIYSSTVFYHFSLTSKAWIFHREKKRHRERERETEAQIEREIVKVCDFKGKEETLTEPGKETEYGEKRRKYMEREWKRK